MRKNLFFIAIWILLYPALLQAQNFKAGAFVGLSTSQVSGDDLAGFDKAGLYAGGFVKLPLSTKFDVQMELTYVGKGSRPTDKDSPDHVYPTLNYVEVPALMIYKVKPQLNIEGGLALGILVYSREEDLYAEVPIQNPYNKLDFSFALGLDYFLSEKISINSRWINSIIRIREHQSGQTYGLNRGQYNSVITFSLRYHF